MKRKHFLTLVAVAWTLAALPRAALSNQMGLGNPLKVNALGISADYARTNRENDAGLHASYRYGFVHLISPFFSADAGYRFVSNSVNLRAGGQIMFILIGLEAGLICSYRTKDDVRKWYDRTRPPGPWAPGAYVGLAGVIPCKPMIVFLSAGGNFFFINRKHEFYLMATALFNFSTL